MNITLDAGDRPPLADILRSVPAAVRSEISHRFLENTFLRWSETTVAATLSEKPNLIGQLRARLKEMEDTIVAGYHPRPLLESLSSLAELDEGLRLRLSDVVDREFAARFRPGERLDALRRCAEAFLSALGAWHGHVTQRGVSSESAPLWDTLRRTATGLREVLNDPELRLRWIP